MSKLKIYIKNTYAEKENEHFIKKREEWAVKIGRLFGTPIAKAIANLPIKIHPNVVTLLSIPFAILAAFCFFNNRLIEGAVFFFISYVLDCADGTLARLTCTQSKFGERLDFYADTLNKALMYFGLWYSQYYLYEEWFFGGCIIFAHYAAMAFGYMFISNRTYKTVFPNLSSYYSAADEGILTFFFIPLIPIAGIFRLIFPILVLLQFVSYVILFLRQKNRPSIKKNIKSLFKM
jgi:phosphatidylglycerophosphate synthase